MPTRGGAKHVDHAVTSFNHVRLPAEAMLGDLDRPKDLRLNFLAVIWRVAVGSIALITRTAPGLKMSAYIAGKYSLYRMVKGPDGRPMPIMAFRTQQLPILHALCAGYVLEALNVRGAALFVNNSDHRVQHGIAAAVKAVMAHHSSQWHVQLGARCGAQGLYAYNQIFELEVSLFICLSMLIPNFLPG
jgi:acyl-CoA oxidase